MRWRGTPHIVISLRSAVYLRHTMVLVFESYSFHANTRFDSPGLTLDIAVYAAHVCVCDEHETFNLWSNRVNFYFRRQNPFWISLFFSHFVSFTHSVAAVGATEHICSFIHFSVLSPRPSAIIRVLDGLLAPDWYDRLPLGQDLYCFAYGLWSATEKEKLFNKTHGAYTHTHTHAADSRQHSAHLHLCSRDSVYLNESGMLACLHQMMRCVSTCRAHRNAYTQYLTVSCVICPSTRICMCLCACLAEVVVMARWWPSDDSVLGADVLNTTILCLYKQ